MPTTEKSEKNNLEAGKFYNVILIDNDKFMGEFIYNDRGFLVFYDDKRRKTPIRENSILRINRICSCCYCDPCDCH